MYLITFSILIFPFCIIAFPFFFFFCSQCNRIISPIFENRFQNRISKCFFLYCNVSDILFFFFLFLKFRHVSSSLHCNAIFFELCMFQLLETKLCEKVSFSLKFNGRHSNWIEIEIEIEQPVKVKLLNCIIATDLIFLRKMLQWTKSWYPGY